MVVSEYPHFIADNDYIPSFVTPQNDLDINTCGDVHTQWTSLPCLDDTVGSSTLGEEGLTQSSGSEKEESDEAVDSPFSRSRCGLTEERVGGLSIFAEIDEGLRNTALDVHPFLNMDEQRSLVENERMQRQYEYFISIGQKNALPPNEVGVSSKSLLNEAHRTHISLVRRYNKMCGEKSLPTKDEEAINHQWRCIESSVERDLYMEGFVFVQRRLSCICIFNPDSDERPYWDNEDFREQRLIRQGKVLERLAEQARKGRNPFFVMDA
ncbi:hypothetical protein DQ04_08071030 [Trypanosoma grayi]|uniref:hypothetical protein n=1 Tax=Trypanosoma grayi TaxID=71804 RepID=UPI0004F45185|nr:hypothetical protein DQ04_08071030 [Trypanosoma grayi]KEG08074.1 hypothetical protein DQ04_08071030 [Trypanosoma grayi]